MPLRKDAVGKISEPRKHSYDWKDVALYALGIGATTSELDFLYEARGPRVFPTYAVVPTFYTLLDLLPLVGGNPMGIVHGSQIIRLHDVFAPRDTLITSGRVAGIWDLKKMAVADFATETKTADGKLLCETEWQIIFRFDGGFDGEPPPARDRVKTPERAPDFRVEESTSNEQAILYRLNGDLNPLHVDPKIGEAAGFGRPILHGLCTYGYVGRAILQTVCGGDPKRFRRMSGQFRRPVMPGDTIITEGWRENRRVIVRASTKDKPEEYAFANAYAEVD